MSRYSIPQEVRGLTFVFAPERSMLDTLPMAKLDDRLEFYLYTPDYFTLDEEEAARNRDHDTDSEAQVVEVSAKSAHLPMIKHPEGARFRYPLLRVRESRDRKCYHPKRVHKRH
jgi:hypothetical protein